MKNNTKNYRPESYVPFLDKTNNLLANYNGAFSDAVVPFGDDNLYPQKLETLINKVSEVERAIELYATAIIGGGLVSEEQENTIINKDGLTLYEWLQQVTLDIIRYKGMTSLLNYNGLGTITEILPINIEDVRFMSTNEQSIKDIRQNGKAIIRTNWGHSYNEGNEQEFAIYGQDLSKIQKNNGAVFYKHLNYGRELYPKPLLGSLMWSMQTLLEVDVLLCRILQNGFKPTTIVQYHDSLIASEVSQEETDKKERDFNDQVIGSINAGSTLMIPISGSNINIKGENISDKINIQQLDTKATYRDNKEYATMARDKIDGHFNIPRVLLNNKQSSFISNENYQEGMKQLYITTRPYRLFLEKYTKEILKNSIYSNLASYKIKPSYELNDKEADPIKQTGNE